MGFHHNSEMICNEKMNENVTMNSLDDFWNAVFTADFCKISWKIEGLLG